MAWQVEHDAAGLPRWQGEDSIINPRSDHSKNVALGIIGLPLFLFALSFGITDSGGVNDAVVKLFRGLAVIFGILGAIIFIRGEVTTKKWFSRSWVLTAEPAALTFKAGGNEVVSATNWRIDTDQIATVEAGRSVDYTPARRDGPMTINTPEYEWQTFLVLTDQTRRVIHHANAARDECATLAASIRAHVEAAHSAAPSSSPDHHAAPSGDGFNL